MDSWNDRQIRAMLAGGNAKLVDHLRKYGVDKLPIVQKYHSAAAAMYRDMLIAARDGKPAPTDIRPYEEEIEAESRGRGGGGGGGISSSGGNTPVPTSGISSAGGGGERPGESPVERELRMRAEAQERLRAKFGNGGLKGQSVNNNGFGSISSSGGGGGGGGSGTGGLDDFLGVDLSAGTQKLAGMAGNVFGKVAEATKVATVRVAEGASVVTKKVQVRTLLLLRRWRWRAWR
jgi:hypothetical protein